MCRSSNFEYHHHHHEEAASDPSTTTTITGFYVRLSADQSSCSFPDSLTLLLLSPAPPTLVSLHRIQLPTDKHFIVFASAKQQPRVRVPTTQSLSFQLYLGESMLLKGAILITKNKSQNHSLNLELCKTNSVSEVELWVAFDGHVAVGDKVTLEKPVPLWRRSNKRNTKLLEDIPEEETEYDSNEEITEEEEGAIQELEMDLEVLRKAMDMGIWALCLGLGFVVSKASLTNFRPPSTFS